MYVCHRKKLHFQAKERYNVKKRLQRFAELNGNALPKDAQSTRITYGGAKQTVVSFLGEFLRQFKIDILP